mmetsp:Transcript_26006/g.88980  ORF Transcript_26006/g.88980 Transcript_26006/m.88980 type:complete len:217 (+) Transcript_26006:5765-6415(+)
MDMVADMPSPALLVVTLESQPPMSALIGLARSEVIRAARSAAVSSVCVAEGAISMTTLLAAESHSTLTLPTTTLYVLATSFSNSASSSAVGTISRAAATASVTAPASALTRSERHVGDRSVLSSSHVFVDRESTSAIVLSAQSNVLENRPQPIVQYQSSGVVRSVVLVSPSMPYVSRMAGSHHPWHAGKADGLDVPAAIVALTHGMTPCVISQSRG